MRHALSFAIALAAALSAAPAAVPLTIAEAESRALEANPKLAAARLEALAAGRRTAESRARHFGEVDLVGSYNNFESPRLVRPMSIELFKNPAAGFAQLPWDANQVHYGVAWQIPLLAAGALHEGDRIARLSQGASEHLSLFTRDEVRYNVGAAYRNALVVRHALSAAETLRDALGKDEADAQLKVKLGALAPVDAAKVTFALRGAEAQVADLEAQARTAAAFLAALIGEDFPADGYELSDIPGVPPPVTPGEGDETGLGAKRLDLIAARETTEVFARKKRLAAESFGPRLSLEGNFLRNDAPSLEHSLDTHDVYVLFKIPVFDGLSRLHALREADDNLAAARQRERGKELEIATQVVDARGRLSAAQAQLRAGEAQRTLGKEVARVEHLKLEQGVGKVEDYLVARAQELAGETAYWRGLYAAQSAADYLNFVLGRGGEPW
jgi:outer membrane protein TolC